MPSAPTTPKPARRDPVCPACGEAGALLEQVGPNVWYCQVCSWSGFGPAPGVSWEPHVDRVRKVTPAPA